jgi:hypothetical protein
MECIYKIYLSIDTFLHDLMKPDEIRERIYEA